MKNSQVIGRLGQVKETPNQDIRPARMSLRQRVGYIVGIPAAFLTLIGLVALTSYDNSDLATGRYVPFRVEAGDTYNTLAAKYQAEDRDAAELPLSGISRAARNIPGNPGATDLHAGGEILFIDYGKPGFNPPEKPKIPEHLADEIRGAQTASTGPLDNLLEIQRSKTQ